MHFSFEQIPTYRSTAPLVGPGVADVGTIPTAGQFGPDNLDYQEELIA